LEAGQDQSESRYKQDDNGVRGYWHHSWMEIPTQPYHIPYSLDSDVQLEVFLHEFGHVLGLKDLEDTTCLMQQYICYFYPMINSHDKNILNDKY
jgi:hypothetical protein